MNSFKYYVSKPCLDYYENKLVVINPNDYNILIIERRYGPSWWLIGYKYDFKTSDYFRTDIEEIYINDIPRLIIWCKDYYIKFNARYLTTDLDIIESCYYIYKRYLELVNLKGDF